MKAGRDQPGRMRDVRHERGADFARDLAKRREVDGPRKGRAAGDDELRLMGAGEIMHLVQVDELAVPSNAVGDDGVELARVVDGAAGREVTPVRQVRS